MAEAGRVHNASAHREPSPLSDVVIALTLEGDFPEGSPRTFRMDTVITNKLIAELQAAVRWQ
jgi:hypothetical protein